MTGPRSLLDRALTNPQNVLPWLRRTVSERSWPVLQSLGLHLVPNHFYYPIPDTEDLRRKRPWDDRYPTAGVDLREEAQLALLDEFGAYFEEYTDTGSEFEAHGDGPMLYAMLRAHQPERVLEVGSGASTAITLAAAERNAAEGGPLTEVTAIEPYPDEELRGLARSHDTLTLVEARAEDVPVERYCELDDGDVLFVDSSHVLAVGNDVAHLYLKVLPQLPTGVLVHAHDIRYPGEYPEEWLLDKHYFWTEQYVLQSFLAFNDAFEVLWAGNHMSDQYPDRLAEALPNYDADDDGWPGSFWMRRVA